MATCDVCGKNSVLPEKIGKLTLCRPCSLKIHTPIWKGKVYTSNEDVRQDRKRIVSLARRAGFPDEAIDAIKRYFNKQLIEGLVEIISGGAGQNIVLYEDHFTIDTLDSFDSEEAQAAYRKMMRSSAFSGEDERWMDAAGSVLQGMASGHSLKKSLALAGAGLAGDMLGSRKKQEPEIADPEIFHGMWNLKYSTFRDVFLLIPEDESATYGFIEFQKGSRPNPARDVVFFFDRDRMGSRDIERLYRFLKDSIEKASEERIQRSREAKSRRKDEAEVAQTVIMQPQVSAPEELMKWKQLLDAGAITQDEYNAKKAQLLGL